MDADYPNTGVNFACRSTSEDSQYNHARKIKEQFRDAARRVFEVTLSESCGNGFRDVTYDVSFEEFPDPQASTQRYWVMHKTKRE